MSDLDVDGVRIAYDVQGEGPPVLLVAGTGMPAAMWGVTAAPHLLGAGYQVVTYDNRGVPPSDVPPAPYTVEVMAGDGIAVLEHLGLGPVAVMGASLGGTITQHMALQRPDLVGAAIFMVGVGRVSAMAVGLIRAMRVLFADGVTPPPEVFASLMAPSLLAPPVWHDRDAVEAGLAMAAMFLPPAPEGLLGQYAANEAWAAAGDHLDELAGLDIPVLAIAAEFCNAFPPANVQEAVARMPQARYVELPGAPHVALDPGSNEIIAREIVAFLAEHHPSRQ